MSDFIERLIAALQKDGCRCENLQKTIKSIFPDGIFSFCLEDADLSLAGKDATALLIKDIISGKEEIKEYNDNRPKEDDTEVELIVDFYQRFIYRMKYMIQVGKENGYELISFMGP